jgi:SAM-dependent methyltransferase
MLKVPREYIAMLEGVLRRKGTEVSLREPQSGATARFLDAVAESVKRISTGLTTERDTFLTRQYLKHEDLRQAYLVYYMTTNLLKLWPPLRELAIGKFFEINVEDGGHESRPFRMLDLGSGTGTAVWSMLLFSMIELRGDREFQFLLTDALEANLRDAETFYSEFRSHVRATFKVSGRCKQLDFSDGAAFEKLTSSSGQFDLITMMNALNELPEENDEGLIERIFRSLSDDGAFILVEPGTRELSRRALRFRDRVVKVGGFVFSPCVRSGNCPALDRESDWCHTDVPWQRPEFIECIDDKVGTLRLSLKSTYFVFRKMDANVVDPLLGSRDFFETGRVVSEVFHERGRARAILCNQSGRREYLLNLRDSKPGNMAFAELERYDIIRVHGQETREHDVKVTQGATINRLLEASGARFVDNLAFGVSNFEKS